MIGLGGAKKYQKQEKESDSEELNFDDDDVTENSGSMTSSGATANVKPVSSLIAEKNVSHVKLDVDIDFDIDVDIGVCD